MNKKILFISIPLIFQLLTDLRQRGGSPHLYLAPPFQASASALVDKDNYLDRLKPL
jgi:hypothetical protein